MRVSEFHSDMETREITREKYISGHSEKRGHWDSLVNLLSLSWQKLVQDLLVSLCSTFKLPWGTRFQLGKTGGFVQNFIFYVSKILSSGCTRLKET